MAELEKPESERLLLNLYLSKQIKAVEDHHGIVDKLSGDEIVAVFEGNEMARKALQCGTAIVKTVCSYRG
jgi:class 3 adenylate cyclase